MFRKEKSDGLKEKIAALTAQLEAMQKKSEHEIKILRQQLASTLAGLPPSRPSVLAGLPYSEIEKDEVEAFIARIPRLLILDVRSDEGWSQGHIPDAKHIPMPQLWMRLHELADKTRPILIFCANGHAGITAAQLLAKEGYAHVFNALGGMAAYKGEKIQPTLRPLSEFEVAGSDRALVARVLTVLDRDVRPGLKRDGGDLQVLAVEGGIVKLKMVGACMGCGAQKRTVEDGIRQHLMRVIPEICGVEDHT